MIERLSFVSFYGLQSKQSASAQPIT